MMESDSDSVLYQLTYEYLQTGKYPDSFDKPQKRQLRRRAEDFLVEDGVVFYQRKGKDVQPRRWISDLGQRNQIMEACHSDKLSGHFGRDKTREKVFLH